MDYHIFHWIWYLLGFMCAPHLTVAIVLSIYGKVLHLPILVMIIVWIVGIANSVKIKKTYE